ncbi:Ribosomal protein S4/S9 [Lasallia pustulata]|uniref:Small ribosomal subunit protein uS4m n=1 Tax=Lasallia pustulata TaxID=136370 RepID=A0A1W5CSL0_9LECA|nr:Ribosomal protein S4/S9 [Lasallia pustulata]
MVRKRFYGLKHVKVRQSWNKYNLYNLSRVENPRVGDRTYFQQKWTAKSLSRGYHGETVREKIWQKMFRPTLRSVVPMDYEYLARTDGSEEALGRGSGLDPPPDKKQRQRVVTPYMNMVYAPLERRLDTAIFRAMFASSTRQARQFVVHGDVKVNGKKMIYPGYMLNPGDMFQVELGRVLYATGAPKDKKERRATRVIRRAKQNAAASEDAENESAESVESSPTAAAKSSEEPQDPKKILSGLLSHAKSILSSDSKDALPAKRKQELRAFQRTIRKTLSRTNTSTILTDDLDAQLMEITSKLKTTAPSLPDDQQTTSDQPAPPPATLSADDRRALRAALIEARENPVDPTKPYATPWRPRDFMSAFAFIPRYLEVNHRICSAVYLRHPVARPGLAEVPTPFSLETNTLAFNWYLRRR